MEIYEMTVDGSGLAFGKSDEALPDFVFSPVFNPAAKSAGLDLVTRMGSPDLAHCVIFRFQDKPGGVFAMHDGGGVLFAAIAKSNLAYALAKGLFGELVANARAGVDIFEDGDDQDA